MMVRNKQGLCLLFLLAASVVTELNGYPDRTLLKKASFKSRTEAKADRPDGTAAAKTDVEVTEGTAEVVAKADSETLATALSGIEKLVGGVVKDIPAKKKKTSKKKFCKNVALAIEKSAEAIAEVGVEASVSVFTFAIVDGVGKACGDASGQAKRSASAYAQAIVDAWAKITGATKAQASSAEASLKSVVRVFAKVSAKAASTACIEADGTRDTPAFAEAYQDVVAVAYAKAAASILVWLEAFVDCGKTGKAFVDATVESALREEDAFAKGDGRTKVEGKGKAKVDADATSLATKVTPCEKDKDLRRCCLGKNSRKKSKKCFCNYSGKSDRRKKNPCTAEKNIADDKTIIWNYVLANGDEGACSC